MKPISTKTHGAADYATAGLLLAAPGLLGLEKRRGAALLRLAGAGALAYSLLTDYELGVQRRLPMRTHLALDAGSGALLAAAPWLLRLRSTSRSSREWLPHLVLGAGEIAAAALTQTEPGGGAAASSGASAAGAPSAARQEGLAHVHAPAPVETPGPSVTPPGGLLSEAERADALKPDAQRLESTTDDPLEALVAEEEAAAAAEAAGIGGRVAHDADDPAMDPVYQAGGGEAEGFEAAEAELVENASHGDGRGDPARDAFTPEVESDLSTAEYGEADEESEPDR